VRTMGVMTARVDGQPVLEENWRADHAGVAVTRALFAYLVHLAGQAGQARTIDELGSVVCGEAEYDDRLRRKVYRGLSGMRRALREAGLQADPLLVEGHRYRLNPEINWIIDTDEARALLKLANARRLQEGLAKAAPIYRQVLGLLQGEYMESISSEGTIRGGTSDAMWWESTRWELGEMRREALDKLVEYCVVNKRYLQAIDLWKTEIGREPLDPLACGQSAVRVAAAYVRAQRQSEGLSTLGKLRDRLRREELDEIPELVRAMALLQGMPTP
jgi:DNA-binding SARP family transcriptional activator